MTDRWAAGDIIAPSSEAPHRMRGLWSLETTPCTITITLLLITRSVVGIVGCHGCVVAAAASRLLCVAAALCLASCCKQELVSRHP